MIETCSMRSCFVFPSSCNAGTRCESIERFSCSNCSGDFCKSSFALSTLLKAEPLATDNEKIYYTKSRSFIHLLSSKIYCCNKKRMNDSCDEKNKIVDIPLFL